MNLLRYRLSDGLAGLADGSLDALVWSGGVPTPAIAELAATIAAADARHRPTGGTDEPAGRLSRTLCDECRPETTCHRAYVLIGVPDLLLCRQQTSADLVAAVVNVLATDAPQLVPPYVRGLQYLDAPSMIQTGLIPLHPGAVGAYRRLHG